MIDTALEQVGKFPQSATSAIPAIASYTHLGYGDWL